MGFIAVECPSCGANLTLNDSRDFAFCEYCGKKIVQDKKVIELQGSVEVKGIATEESLLERGYLLLEDKNFNKAYQYFNRVCDINPRCSKAYWGMLLCQLKATKENVLIISDKTLDSYSNYQKAIRFADDKERKRYTDINQQIYIRLSSEESNAKKAKVTYILFVLLSVVCAFFGVSVFIASFFAPNTASLIVSICVVIAFLIPLVILIKSIRKQKEIIKIVENRKLRLNNSKRR